MPTGKRARKGYEWIQRGGQWIERRVLTAAERQAATRKRIKTMAANRRQRAAAADGDVTGPPPKTRRGHARRGRAHARGPDIDDPKTNGQDEPIMERLLEALGLAARGCNYLYAQYPDSRELNEHCRADEAHACLLAIERALRRVSRA